MIQTKKRENNFEPSASRRHDGHSLRPGGESAHFSKITRQSDDIVCRVIRYFVHVHPKVLQKYDLLT
ncbi:hypothetical protein E2C01_055139 [Portunus trituberculatus]|uniref:Uncharacterized protein n=1 Tax=Portunus trituberculatus TaxID=210409 RepID=A0A5B7GU04_PORTR|nr:hypothetical protein [Portunus trituberculatus]